MSKAEAEDAAPGHTGPDAPKDDLAALARVLDIKTGGERERAEEQQDQGIAGFHGAEFLSSAPGRGGGGA